MAEWWEEENAFRVPSEEETAASQSDWHNQPGAFEGQSAAEQRFPVDPALTQEKIEEMQEMTDSSRIIEGFTPKTGAGPAMETLSTIGTEATQAWLNLTTSDPLELGMILQNRFPEVVQVRVSPEGVPVARNKLTGYEAVINKPGFSGQDVLQAIGLVGQFLPSAKMTTLAATPLKLAGGETIRRTGRAALTGAATAGGTQALAEEGQAAAGGEWDPEDVALAGGFGGAAEFVAPALVGMGTKAKEYFGPIADVVPRSVSQALKFAKERGYQIMTSDALQERLTAPMRIFLKVTERIPVFGTAGQRVAQNAQRADALSQVAREYGIDIESDLGQEVAESFVERMLKMRWFGKNERFAQPGAATPEMLERAFMKEADGVLDSVLKKRIGAIDDVSQVDEGLMDLVFNANNGRRANDLFNKLTPDGQTMMQQQWIANGLRRAGWEPDVQSTIPNPEVFVKYMDNFRDTFRQIFPDEAQRGMLEGAREFIRMTGDAAKSGQGAGMTAAMSAGSAVYLFDVLGGAIAGAGTGFAGKGMQSALVRDLFLRLKHAKGDPAKVTEIMRAIRPYILAAGERMLGSKVDMPGLHMGTSGADVAGGAASLGEAAGDIAEGVMGSVNPFALVGEPPPSEESAVVGPGMDQLRRAAGYYAGEE